MDLKYSKNSRSERKERKKSKDNIYTGKHIRIVIEKQNNYMSKTQQVNSNNVKLSKKKKSKK
jgi:hypothetical protein